MYKTLAASEKRKKLAQAIKGPRILAFPGAFCPFVAKLIELEKFDGVYVSGAAISAAMGLPDIGLTSQSEVVTTASQICRVTPLPTIVDADTGFGEPINVARTLFLLEEAGLAGCHLEDQRNPKRCGHLENKELVSRKEMIQRISAAINSISDENFLLIARTDARAVEGLDKAIDRAKSYVDAGARMIFPEALKNEYEFEKFRENLDVPLLANMTEFGKSPIFNLTKLENLGYNIVIYPVTTFRLGMKAIENGLKSLKENGDQANTIETMMTRAELYEVLGYSEYAKIDSKIYNID